ERLGDRSLVMLPGSRHPETGNLYRFEEGRSPFEVEAPCVAPAWVLYLTPVDRPRRDRTPPPGWLGRLPDKVGLARDWGLKFTGTVRNGWHECHAFDRADRTPSAAVHEESGYYVDLGSGTRLTLIQLAVAAGPFATEADAMASLRSGVI